MFFLTGNYSPKAFRVNKHAADEYDPLCEQNVFNPTPCVISSSENIFVFPY